MEYKRLGNWGSNLGKAVSLYSKDSERFGVHPGSCPVGCRRLSARHEADHSPPSNVEVKTVWNYSSLPSRLKSVPCNYVLEHSSEKHTGELGGGWRRCICGCATQIHSCKPTSFCSSNGAFEVACFS